ncbi:MAG: long-chain-fatty-acid--CoA ligase [Deltaproteobacteria bacterium]|nr:long-chain-fatty-acid--CoA ligase [Deltaproteobacteria bacterium]MCL5792246.1 long-chain-fatty-acid--CoA ligase [Deltaproteobacteria bacterium]
MELDYKDLRELVEKRAEESKDKPYIYFYDEVISFTQFNERVNRFANGLKSIGVKKGDTVHIYINNSPEFLYAALAANKLGALAGPINCWWSPEEVKFLLNDSEGKYLIVESSYYSNVEQIKPELNYLQKIVYLGEDHPEGVFPYKELMKNSEFLEPVNISPDDDAYLFYTSGTTGKPKGALLTHSNSLYAVMGVRSVLHSDEEKGDEVALIFLPLFHVNAMMSMISALYSGVTVALRLTFSASEFGEVVEKYKVTFFSGVPAVYNILIFIADDVKKHDLSSLKFGVCGAAPLSEETFKKFESTYNIKIIEGYGLTEGTVVSTLNPLNGERKIGSIGNALPGQDVKVVDDDGAELQNNQIGEIVIKGGAVMKRYHKRPEETAQTVIDGWLHTGDIGYKDDEGYFYIVDRKKDMIIRGGENIYPKEIENILFEHPKVMEAAVIGIEDSVMGEEGKAFIVLKPGENATEEEIKSYLKSRLAEFKIPKYIEFIDDLPKNIIGKVLKKELRAKEKEKNIKAKKA